MKEKHNPDFMYFNLSACQSERDGRDAVESFKFDGEFEWITPPKQNPPKGKVIILTCKHCGHRDFNDDGRFLGEFSCNGCDRFVQVAFKKI